MKTLRNLLLALTALSAVSFTTAVTYTDIDLEGTNGEGHYVKLSSGYGYSTWSSTFNLLEGGFDPAISNIVSAIVEFAFADDTDSKWSKKNKKYYTDKKDKVKEYFEIIVGGETLWADLEVDGVVSYTDNNSPGYARYSMHLSADQLVDLQDGVIDYSVRATWGDAYLKEAKIVAYGDVAKIPDSVATGSLLAVVLIGMIAFRRSTRQSV